MCTLLLCRLYCKGLWPLNDWGDCGEEGGIWRGAVQLSIANIVKEAKEGRRGKGVEQGGFTTAFTWCTTCCMCASIAFILQKAGRVMRHMQRGVLRLCIPAPFHWNAATGQCVLQHVLPSHLQTWLPSLRPDYSEMPAWCTTRCMCV